MLAIAVSILYQVTCARGNWKWGAKDRQHKSSSRDAALEEPPNCSDKAPDLTRSPGKTGDIPCDEANNEREHVLGGDGVLEMHLQFAVSPETWTAPIEAKTASNCANTPKTRVEKKHKCGSKDNGTVQTYRQPSLVKPYPRILMWLPMVVHSLPLMTPMFLTDKMVKNRSLSARSFQFLFILGQGGSENPTRRQGD